MNRSRILGLAAATAVGALVLAACGGSSGTGTAGNKTTPAAAGQFNAGLSKVINPSNVKTNGTITFEDFGAPDSTDPDRTYYAANWNFIRLYTTPLMTFKSCPGNCGLAVVPAIAA